MNMKCQTWWFKLFLHKILVIKTLISLIYNEYLTNIILGGDLVTIHIYMFCNL